MFKPKSKQYDSDGLNDQVYGMLWYKDTLYRSVLKLNLPDTVIFSNGEPLMWYFSNKDGVILKKNISKINIENIKKSFLKKSSKYGIVGYYIYELKMHNDNVKSIIEYYDKNTLDRLFQDPVKLQRGILQRFLDPAGDRNSLIQVVYTKNLTLFTRRTNYRKLEDTNSNIFEKCATFEGPEYLSEAHPIRGEVLPANLKKLIDSVINHFKEISLEKYQVSKLIAHIKIDHDDKLWFLWVDMLRFSQKIFKRYNGQFAKENPQGTIIDTDPIDLNEHIKIPKNMIPKIDMRFMNKNEDQTMKRCLKCNLKHYQNRFLMVEYKDIIKEYENKKKEGYYEDDDNNNNDSNDIYNKRNKATLEILISPSAKNNQKINNNEKLRAKGKYSEIPPTILRHLPKIKPHEFHELKDQLFFKSTKIPVCMECCYDLLKYSHNGIPEPRVHNQIELKKMSKSNKVIMFKPDYKNLPELKFKIDELEQQRLKLVNQNQYHTKNTQMISNNTKYVHSSYQKVKLERSRSTASIRPTPETTTPGIFSQRSSITREIQENKKKDDMIGLRLSFTPSINMDHSIKIISQSNKLSHSHGGSQRNSISRQLDYSESAEKLLTAEKPLKVEKIRSLSYADNIFHCFSQLGYQQNKDSLDVKLLDKEYQAIEQIGFLNEQGNEQKQKPIIIEKVINNKGDDSNLKPSKKMTASTTSQDHDITLSKQSKFEIDTELFKARKRSKMDSKEFINNYMQIDRNGNISGGGFSPKSIDIKNNDKQFNQKEFKFEYGVIKNLDIQNIDGILGIEAEKSEEKKMKVK